MSWAVLDTSIQIDRIKSAYRRSVIEECLTHYNGYFATGISLLEFKAVVIQQLITIHNQLRRSGARFTHVRDALIEKNVRQQGLRAHIFNNLICVYGSSMVIDEDADVLLAKKARMKIENIIPILYRDIRESEYLNAPRANCTRAEEPPVKKGRGFDPNIPHCKRGKNKFCRVEDLIRQEGGGLIDYLHSQTLDPNSQLERSLTVFERVIGDPNAELSASDCRTAGDCLIGLESIPVGNVVTTNAKEWEHIGRALGIQVEVVAYPNEQTR